MKQLSRFLILISAISCLAACLSNSVVGKYYQPNGNTPCPATQTISAYEKMIDAAKNKDNELTIQMMFDGEILNLNVTKSYRIVDQGSNWYKISSDGEEYYVSPALGRVHN